MMNLRMSKNSTTGLWRLACIVAFAALCVGYNTRAQDFHLKTYASRYNFITGMHNFPTEAINSFVDTLGLLEKKAAAEGDNELAAMLRLRSLWAVVNEGRLVNDSIERSIKLIGFQAASNREHCLEAEALQTLGDFYAVGRQHSAAIDQFIAAYDIYKNLTVAEFPPKMEYTSVLGSSFYRLEDYEKALKYFREALAIMDETHSGNFPAVYNTIGASYRALKRYDSAVLYFQKTYDRAVAENARAYQGIALGNIGITYFLQGRYEDAIPLLQSDIETSLATHQLRNAASSLTTLATIYNDTHRYREAEALLKEALSLIEGKPFSPDYGRAEPIFRQLYTTYSAKKDFRAAALYADSAMAAKDSVEALNNALTLAKAHDKLEYAQHKLEAEKLQSQINMARLEISKNRLQTIYAIIGVTVLLIVMLFIIRLNGKITNQKRELERLNAVKDRMFSTISHDLRTPVNSLVSFTQLLEQGDIPAEKLQKYAAALKDTLGYTAGLMENLLSWARTQMQGYKPVFEHFDIAENTKQTLGLLAPEAEKKGVRIINNVPGDSIVHADFNMASLVIRNLVSNAIKYTPQGGTITLTSARENGSVRIHVSDTGIGIPRDLVTKFNNSKETLDSTPGTKSEKGTGLGLMLCKGFAELMRGKLTLDSEPGKGSIFTVELPAGS